MTSLRIAACVLLIGSGFASAASVSQLAELTRASGQSQDLLGVSVAISGNTVVAGVPNASIAFAYQGAACVFVKPATGWTNMTQTAELYPSDPSTEAAFGSSVAISGDTIVVGSPNAAIDGVPGHGAVYVFVKPKSGWTNMAQTAEFIAPVNISNISMGFGGSVAISGNTIVVGAPSYGTNNQGTAYVFVKPANGWQNTYGTYTAQLSASDLGGTSYDNFGQSVAISGNTIVIGEPNNGSTLSGAYLYVQPTGGWVDTTETAKLTSSNGILGDGFGVSVSVSGNTALVGANCPRGGCTQGAAYVFVEPPGGWTNMTETAELTASNAFPGDNFGQGVSLNGTVAVIGADNVTVNFNHQGAVYGYLKPQGGWQTTSQYFAEVTSSDAGANDELGFSVGVSSSTAVAGAPLHTVGQNQEQGAAYVFGP